MVTAATATASIRGGAPGGSSDAVVWIGVTVRAAMATWCIPTTASPRTSAAVSRHRGERSCSTANRAAIEANRATAADRTTSPGA
ncbi:hypothetical protein D3C81_1780820 [compost metagenome]